MSVTANMVLLRFVCYVSLPNRLNVDCLFVRSLYELSDLKHNEHVRWILDIVLCLLNNHFVSSDDAAVLREML